MNEIDPNLIKQVQLELTSIKKNISGTFKEPSSNKDGNLELPLIIKEQLDHLIELNGMECLKRMIKKIQKDQEDWLFDKDDQYKELIKRTRNNLLMTVNLLSSKGDCCNDSCEINLSTEYTKASDEIKSFLQNLHQNWIQFRTNQLEESFKSFGFPIHLANAKKSKISFYSQIFDYLFLKLL